jgi:hypothetical protein
MNIPDALFEAAWYEQCDACHEWFLFIEEMIWEPSDNSYWCQECYPASKYM